MLTERQARARAQAARSSFPSGTITIPQAIDMLMATVDSQVGYGSNSSTFSMYGKPENWRSSDWNGRQVYWCGEGASWAFDWTFGAKAAIAGIGLQNTNRNWPPVGWTATWLWLGWLRGNGRWVGMEAAQPGDISIQSWGRTGKESDHVEVVTGYYRSSDDSYPTIGFNTATGNATAGAGVQRARRYRWHTVGIYRPDWAALVTAYNAQQIGQGVLDLTEEVIEGLDLLGYHGSVAGVRKFQDDHDLVADGIVGPATSARLEIEVGKAVDEIKAHIDVLRRERTNAHVEEGANQKQILANQATILANQDALRQQNNTIGRIAAEARDKFPPLEEVFERFIDYGLYGYSIGWWLRRGFLGRKHDHKNYPFDPGSPADLEHRTAEAVLGETIAPYGSKEKKS